MQAGLFVYAFYYNFRMRMRQDAPRIFHVG